MRYLTRLLIAFIVFTGLAGCSTARIQDTPPDRSLVFVYVDFTENEMDLYWTKMKKVSPVSETPFFNIIGVRNFDGKNKYGYLLWYEFLENGSYQLASFGGKQTLYMRQKQLTLLMPEMGGNQTSLRVQKPGIYYMGSFKYKPELSTWAEVGGVRNKFTMEPFRGPSETEMLKKLLEVSKGTSWEPRIQEKLRQGSL